MKINDIYFMLISLTADFKHIWQFENMSYVKYMYYEYWNNFKIKKFLFGDILFISIWIALLCTVVSSRQNLIPWPTKFISLCLFLNGSKALYMYMTLTSWTMTLTLRSYDPYVKVLWLMILWDVLMTNDPMRCTYFVTASKKSLSFLCFIILLYIYHSNE